MFKEKHCSPRKGKIKTSCISKKTLLKIADLLNKKYNTKIKIKKRTKEELYKDIKKQFQKSECETESCWSTLSIFEKLPFKEKKMIEDSFKPRKPLSWKKKPTTWLTTNDIDKVMVQYEKKYPHFKYFGALPIDFNLKDRNNNCLINNICKINTNEYRDKCIGIVLNTDPHNKPGQHWFSIYIDFIGINRENPSFYYFDSANPIQNINDLPYQILEFIEKIQSQHNYQLDVLYNDIKHQYGNTECGIYSLHFLTEMLKGIPFEEYIQQNLTDKKIKKYRDIFFIN